MSFWGILFPALVGGVFLFVVLKKLIGRVTIYDYERGVAYWCGRFQKVLQAGSYLILRLFQEIKVLDMRSRVLSVTGQEILSADNISVKISAALRYHVASPEVAVQGAQSYEEALYLEVQLILRDLISALPVEDLLQKREEMAGKLRERLQPKAEQLGLSLETVGVKDIMFPGGLKQIFAQVVDARKAAQASLEKARGETATLRHLANAAKLLEGNPALVTLKTLQAASDGKHTLVLGVSQPVIPVPRGEEAPALERPSPSREKGEHQEEG